MIKGRIRERDLVIPALRAAASSPGGEITTTKLIETLEEQFRPEGEDAEILDGRRDSKFSQIVRNLVSHKESGTSMFSKGYAVHVKESESIRITDAGRAYLDQFPE
jgi:hypothetical protein